MHDNSMIILYITDITTRPLWHRRFEMGKIPPAAVLPRAVRLYKILGDCFNNPAVVV